MDIDVNGLNALRQACNDMLGICPTTRAAIQIVAAGLFMSGLIFTVARKC